MIGVHAARAGSVVLPRSGAVPAAFERYALMTKLTFWNRLDEL